MTDPLVNIQLLIQRDVCSRICAINQLKLQAINIGLDKSYITLLDNLLLDAIRLTSQEAVTALYDSQYDTIIEAREVALQQFVNSLKASVTMPPKT